MDSGFRAEHFELLQRYESELRDNTNQAQNRAYQSLAQAYDATAEWAGGVLKTLFPDGIINHRSRPTDRAQKFKPYTWTRIYPRENAPRELAYTVGIDASGEFCVKIDTIFQKGNIQRRYEMLQGGNNHISPFAAVMTAEDGLRLSQAKLIEWAVDSITRFNPSYDTLARELGLVQPSLRLVSDQIACSAAFRSWSHAMTEKAVKRGSALFLPENRVFLRQSNAGGRVKLKLGLDPLGHKWAVEINEPRIAGKIDPLSAVGEDSSGGLYLLRQGWLRGARPEQDVMEDAFIQRTGLKPTSVDVPLLKRQRQWFIVANLGDPAEAIRRDTSRFVSRCWDARAPVLVGSDLEEQSDLDDSEMPAGGETGGFYMTEPRDARGAARVDLLQGMVWEALARLLSARRIGYGKCRMRRGFAIDMEIKRPTGVPLLLEIKSGSSASDIHTGVGQLCIYRTLFRHLSQHAPVLLVAGSVHPMVKRAVQHAGIELYCYTFEEDGDGFRVQFQPDFLDCCGLN